MIPTKTNVESTITGLETQTFTIQVNDKSFRVLLDGLYTDKPQSIIRELWTNALDSHIGAGIADQPFHCELPSRLSPTFSVRDYGTSMTHDEVMHLYSTVFASTKTETNNQTGCLGLGSKSPFSYTDSFTAIAYSGSEKRTYIASLNTDGIPTITLLSREPSGEPRGFEISFAVQNHHIYNFQHAAERVVIGFDVRPTGTEINAPQPIFEADGFKILSDLGHSELAFVRQGPVVYPVPYDVMRSVAVPLVRNRSFIIDVPIGSVEFTASREALQLTDSTSKYLIQRMNEDFTKLTATALQDIQSQVSFMKSYKSYNAWSEFMKLPAMKVHGKTIDRAGLLPITNNGPFPKLMVTGKRASLEPIKFNVHNEIYFPTKDIDKTIFVIDSGEKVLRKRKRYAEFDKAASHPTYWVDNPTASELMRLMRLLDVSVDQFINVSELPDVEVATDSSTGKPRTSAGGLYVIHPNRTTSRKTALTDDDKFYWLPVEKARPTERVSFSAIGVTLRFQDVWGKSGGGWIEYYMKQLTEWGIERDIIIMTPRLVEKYSRLRGARFHQDRLDVALSNAIIERSEEICATISLPTHDDFGYGGGLRVLSDIINGKHKRELMTSFLSRIRNIEDLVEGYEEALDAKRQMVKYYEDRYPMLFTNDEDNVKEYIKIMDKHHKKNNKENK
jgi:hypothetical protein